MPTVSAEVLSAWATEQGKILSVSGLDLSEKLNAVAFVLLCGGDKGTQKKDIKTAKRLAQEWSE